MCNSATRHRNMSGVMRFVVLAAAAAAVATSQMAATWTIATRANGGLLQPSYRLVNSGGSGGRSGGGSGGSAGGGSDGGNSGSGNSNVYLVPGQLVVARPNSPSPIYACLDANAHMAGFSRELCTRSIHTLGQYPIRCPASSHFHPFPTTILSPIMHQKQYVLFER